jgi:hypothetical protein
MWIRNCNSIFGVSSRRGLDAACFRLMRFLSRTAQFRRLLFTILSVQPQPPQPVADLVPRLRTADGKSDTGEENQDRDDDEE